MSSIAFHDKALLFFFTPSQSLIQLLKKKSLEFIDFLKMLFWINSKILKKLFQLKSERWL